MVIEYTYKNRRFKDDSMCVTVRIDWGTIKGLCPKNPLAVWTLTIDRYLSPIFNLDMTPIMVYYTNEKGTSQSMGQLLYDIKRRRVVQRYTYRLSNGSIQTRVLKEFIGTSYPGLKGVVKIR